MMRGRVYLSPVDSVPDPELDSDNMDEANTNGMKF
jgi:hypothetical protein